VLNYFNSTNLYFHVTVACCVNFIMNLLCHVNFIINYIYMSSEMLLVQVK
jgi:hypothetical protein